MVLWGIHITVVLIPSGSTYDDDVPFLNIGEEQFELEWQRSFAHPIHCLWYGDLTNDGLCELVIVSMGGIHILQV